MTRLNPLARRFASLALLLALAMLVAVAPAHAITAGCRSDPVVLLSNGATMDLSADIAAPLWQVEEVIYELHAPVGTSVVAVIHTPSWPTTVERFHFYADNPAGHYDTYTTVHTEGEGTAVSANWLYLMGLLTLGMDTESGISGEPIHMSLPN